MKTYRIASYPGDGIGVEVIEQAERVVLAVARKHGFQVVFQHFPWNCQYAMEHHGAVVPNDFLEQLRPFDAIFLGAVGDPRLIPDHVSLVPLIQMRQRFEQYACLRPAKLYPQVPTPLANRQVGDIDMLIVRENSEGEYANVGGRLNRGTPQETALQTSCHTRRGVERIIRYACEMARARRGHLTMATKSNALAYAMVLWDDILAEVKQDYPDLTIDKQHVDALSMLMVKAPTRFDVIVGSNLFGDILSDLAAALVGSLGLTPSANLNPERLYPSLFEPVHGSAPDIAGKGIANPVAAIRSAAMMLDFLGEAEAAQTIDDAVTRQLSDSKVRTPDLGGNATTAEVTDDLLAGLGAS